MDLWSTASAPNATYEWILTDSCDGFGNWSLELPVLKIPPPLPAPIAPGSIVSTSSLFFGNALTSADLFVLVSGLEVDPTGPLAVFYCFELHSAASSFLITQFRVAFSGKPTQTLEVSYNNNHVLFNSDLNGECVYYSSAFVL